MKELPTQTSRKISQYLAPKQMGYINKQFQTHGQTLMEQYRKMLRHHPLRSQLLYLLQCLRFFQKEAYTWFDPGVAIPITVDQNGNTNVIELEYDIEADKYAVFVINYKTGRIIRDYRYFPCTSKGQNRVLAYIQSLMTTFTPEPVPRRRVTIDDIHLLVHHKLL